MNFGEKLKQLRKTNNISQEELAEILDVSRQTISRWESSLTTPDLISLEKICQHFHLSYDELLENKKTKKKNIIFLPIIFIGFIILSFILPSAKQDMMTSAIIITPAGFCLYTGIIGITASLIFMYINHRK